MKARGLLFAGAFVLVSNGIVLLGVVRNQAASPLQTMQLTERELPRQPHGKEDSGLSLRLQWERNGPAYTDQYAWLDQTKLEELGFDIRAVLRDPKHPPLERPAFVTLEYDGPAWKEWLTAMEKQPNAARLYESTMASRLFVIDAASRPEQLFEKYRDRQRYLILKGVVRVGVVNWQPNTRAPGPDRLQAAVSRLLPQSIHVPPSISGALASLSDGITASPRYSITLSFGRRFEPWIVSRAE
jgi:hypothetical protein